MSRDKLFLLPPEFADPAYPGQRFFCQNCAVISYLLKSFPDLARNLDVQYVGFERPRAAVAALVGEANQSLPLLVLGDGPSADLETNIWNGVRFISATKDIIQALTKRHGFPQPHP